MAKYYGVFSCGHEGYVNVAGPQKNREYIINKKFSGLCPDCWEKKIKEEREQAYKNALEQAKKLELPSLTGTEKQVKWADILRQDFINKFNEDIKIFGNGLFLDEELKNRCSFLIRKIERIKSKLNTENQESKFYEKYEEKLELVEKEIKELEKEKISLEDVIMIENYILIHCVEATFYIDNRYESICNIIKSYKDIALKSDKEKIIEEQERKLEDEINKEDTVYPQERITNSVIIIENDNNILKAKFEKNNDFIKIVKNYRMVWENGYWKRKINLDHDFIEDRMAELGNILLKEGFPVRIRNEKIRKMAIDGTFREESTKWIDIDSSKKFLLIKWLGYSDKLYKAAKKLTSAKWDSCMKVKIEYANEVEEFAEEYGFKLINKTKKAIEEYKNSLANINIVNPK